MAHDIVLEYFPEIREIENLYGRASDELLMMLQLPSSILRLNFVHKFSSNFQFHSGEG